VNQGARWPVVEDRLASPVEIEESREGAGEKLSEVRFDL